MTCPYCRGVFLRRRDKTRQKLRAEEREAYCSRACRGKHTIELQIILQEGVRGRICSQCETWTPLPKMTAKGRGKVCRRCKRAQPHQRFSVLRCKARRKGWRWELTKEQFMTFWQSPCHYCGAAIDTVGLDRVDSNLGYITDNVAPCCQRCNFGKSNTPVEAFLERCRRISQRFSQS